MARDLERLQALHLKIAELCIEGLRPVDIAEELGMPAKSISRITQSALFQDHLARRRREVLSSTDESFAESQARLRNRISLAGEEAIGTLSSLMDEEKPDAIQLKSATEVLRLAFGGQESPSSKGQAGPTNQVNVQLLVTAMQESQKDSEELFSGEVVEVPTKEKDGPECNSNSGG